VTNGKNEILRLKRRFLKESSNRSDFFAKNVARRNLLREVNTSKFLLVDALWPYRQIKVKAHIHSGCL